MINTYSTSSCTMPLLSYMCRFPEDSLYLNEETWRMIRIGEGPLGFGRLFYQGLSVEIELHIGLHIGLVSSSCLFH